MQQRPGFDNNYPRNGDPTCVPGSGSVAAGELDSQVRYVRSLVGHVPGIDNAIVGMMTGGCDEILELVSQAQQVPSCRVHAKRIRSDDTL